MRVFGAFKHVHQSHSDNVTTDTDKTSQLEQEIEHLRQLVTAQQSHIDRLKQAMLLIESKMTAPRPIGRGAVTKNIDANKDMSKNNHEPSASSVFC